MYVETHYVLLHDLPIPGSYAVALRKGDQITETQRATGNLRVGLDVAPLNSGVMARPSDDAGRAEWQDYAVVRGVPYHEAVGLDTADLRARADEEPELPEAPAELDPPADSDRKALWLDYAVARIEQKSGGEVSQDLARERLADLTKAQLMEAFGPEGDSGPQEWYVGPNQVVVGPGGLITPAVPGPQPEADNEPRGGE